MKATQLKRLRARLLMQELMIVVGIIMIVGPAQLMFYVDAIYKAILVEPLIQMHSPQMEVIERLALFGNWDGPAPSEAPATGLESPIKRMASQRRIASARDLEETHASLSRTEALALDIEGLGSRKQSSSNAVIGLSNGVPMAVVASSFVQTPSIIEFRPIVNPSAPAMVNWLCGGQQTFAGQPAVAPREPAVPVDLLPFPCRARL
jgi:hypothetical protein